MVIGRVGTFGEPPGQPGEGGVERARRVPTRTARAAWRRIVAGRRRNGKSRAPKGRAERGISLARVPAHDQNPQTAVAAGARHVGAALMSRAACAPAARSISPASPYVITGAARPRPRSRVRSDATGRGSTLAARDQGELERAREDLRARGIDADAITCDVRDRDEARQLVREVVARTGRIDVLINNAGIIQVGPLEHMQRGDFEEAMDVHFWGPLHTMLAAIPEMRRRAPDASSTSPRLAERSACRIWRRTARASSRSSDCPSGSGRGREGQNLRHDGHARA